MTVVLTTYFYLVLLNLHRPYLVQVLSTKPVDLERHRYRASVMACYRSAWRMIRATIYTFRREPQRISRISLIWSHCLSSIVRIAPFDSRERDV